tara:strand:+ start:574 stop:1380 length:807 start_codon:yes stop_codon:yes gene_type:complete
LTNRPQIEDGYTRIANELMDALCAASLTAREYAVALAILRKTYGWRKKLDRLSGTQIAQMTGIPAKKVGPVITSLAAKRVITIHGERRRGFTPKLGIQKDWSRWPLRRNPQMGGISTPPSKQETPIQGVTETPISGVSETPNRGAYKRNKEKKENIYSALLERDIRFGSLACLLPAGEVERWIAIRPGGRAYTPAEVSAWFLAQHPRLVAEGKDPISTARRLFSQVRPVEVKRAINWVETTALVDMKRRKDEREKDALDDFASAFGLK